MSRPRRPQPVAVPVGQFDDATASNVAAVAELLGRRPDLEDRVVQGWRHGGSRLRWTMLQLGIEPVEYDPRFELLRLRRGGSPEP